MRVYYQSECIVHLILFIKIRSSNAIFPLDLIQNILLWWKYIIACCGLSTCKSTNANASTSTCISVETNGFFRSYMENKIQWSQHSIRRIASLKVGKENPIFHCVVWLVVARCLSTCQCLRLSCAIWNGQRVNVLWLDDFLCGIKHHK